MKLLYFLFLCAVISLSHSYVTEYSVIKEEWRAFKVRFNKVYEDAEDMFRMKIYMENKQKIAKHNQLFGQKKKSYSLQMNKFGDMLHHEFVTIYNGFKRNYNQSAPTGSTFLSPSNIMLPESVDWREYGYVTPVKDQGLCGSCWAFSAQEACHYREQYRGATVTGYVDILSGNEMQLQEAVGTVGPVSVAIDANHVNFQFYHGGVYDEPLCSRQILDHGVLAVGYGTDNGKDYWLVKNSWGSSWGEEGYIKMSRNKGNQCGIATEASYPLV